MYFTSAFFLFGFLPIVLLCNFLVQKHVFLQNLFLILFSALFYAWSEPRLLFLVFGSIAISWCVALGLENAKSRRVRLFILLIAISYNVGLLIYFKYAGWLYKIIEKVIRRDLHIAEIVLPLGISFYTFQAMSYVLDVYRNRIRAQKNIMTVALYILMFPQLVAGPIVRFSEIEQTICSARKFSGEDFSIGVERFAMGFSKKIVLADSCAVISDKAFGLNAQGELGWAMAWVGAIAYTLQIYYDFSGYSDMAIGLGKMLGFRYLENFNYPYIANSITDFWHRWHMSLSIWFKDYVYIPLGGNRKGPIKRTVNLAITWLITGLWHGANMTFVLWGGYYGFLIIVEKIFNIPKRISGKIWWRGIYRLFTLLSIVLCWVLFRAENITEAIRFFGTLLSFKIVQMDMAILYVHTFKFELLFGLIFCIPIVPRLIEHKPQIFKPLNDVMVFFLFLVSISYIFKGTYSPFIYFNF